MGGLYVMTPTYHKASYFFPLLPRMQGKKKREKKENKRGKK